MDNILFQLYFIGSLIVIILIRVSFLFISEWCWLHNFIMKMKRQFLCLSIILRSFYQKICDNSHLYLINWGKQHLPLTYNDTKIWSIDFIRINWKIFCVGLFIVLLYYELSEPIQKISVAKFDDTFKIVAQILERNHFLNFYLSGSMIVACIFFCKRKWANLYKSLGFVFFSIIITEIVCCNSGWNYIKIWPTNYRFDQLIILLIWAPVIVDILKCRRLFHIKHHYDVHKAFTNVLPGESKVETKRTEYAKSFAEKLLYVDIKKSSYAAGISGEWGSGKTTFMKDIQNHTSNKTYQIWFNPWNSQSPKQIIEDYFGLLSSTVHGVYEPLEKMLINYSKLLTELELHPLLDKVIGYIPTDREDNITNA